MATHSDPGAQINGAAMKQFVPLSDGDLERLDAESLRLVPYRVGVPCHHALSAGAAEDGADDQRWNSKVSPGFTPSLSAVPPLSSSTYMAGPLLG